MGCVLGGFNIRNWDLPLFNHPEMEYIAIVGLYNPQNLGTPRGDLWVYSIHVKHQTWSYRSRCKVCKRTTPQGRACTVAPVSLFWVPEMSARNRSFQVRCSTWPHFCWQCIRVFRCRIQQLALVRIQHIWTHFCGLTLECLQTIFTHHKELWHTMAC